MFSVKMYVHIYKQRMSEGKSSKGLHMYKSIMKLNCHQRHQINPIGHHSTYTHAKAFMPSLRFLHRLIHK